MLTFEDRSISKLYLFWSFIFCIITCPVPWNSDFPSGVSLLKSVLSMAKWRAFPLIILGVHRHRCFQFFL
jgi:hypothetical protein